MKEIDEQAWQALACNQDAEILQAWQKHVMAMSEDVARQKEAIAEQFMLSGAMPRDLTAIEGQPKSVKVGSKTVLFVEYRIG